MSGTYMARTPEFDRTSTLEAAMKLFWARGYTATSLPELLSAMGIARSRNETRMVRIVQRMAILESELRRLEGGKPEEQPAPDAPSGEHDTVHRET